MTYSDFENQLKNASLSKKAFSKLVDMNYASVTNWSQNGVPSWVKSWLENYIKSKNFDSVVEVVKPFVKE
jgi:predicted nucleotidyltransferase